MTTRTTIKKNTKRTIKTKRIILCCGTHGRAVIIGDVKSNPVRGEAVYLTNVRMVLRWDKECGGLFGLATKGPKGDTRITEAVPELEETVWQEWMALTQTAIKALDKWPAC